MAEGLRPAGRVTREPAAGQTVAVGDWYWIEWETYDDGYRTKSVKRDLVCVTHVGSNYVKVKTPGGPGARVHFKDFDRELTPEPDAQRIIRGRIEEGRGRVVALMDEVRGLAARLGVGVQLALDETEGPTGSVQALSVRNDGKALDTYKTDLERAKDKTLPELFKQIEAAHKEVAAWMKAELLPLQGMAKALEGVTDTVKARIFAVELYAGLVEQVTRIRDGAPAETGEPVHLFQRRHYMDEECLANYRAGGMRFKDLRAFERWMLRRENLERILPFPRCVAAFKVRRREYREEAKDWQDFISILLSDEREWDKLTFLYIRNGQRVYRLRTGIEFEEKLFPDVSAAQLGGDARIYAHKFTSFDGLVTGEQYDQLVADEQEHNRKVREQAEEDARRREAGDKDAPPPGPWHWEKNETETRYVLWTPDSVEYDDIAAYVKRQVDQHNRVVVVLQGLLDRSEVFHPHPPWQLWTADGFAAGLRLHYDTDRALASGPPPDFEAYRRRLNATLKVGDYATGQELHWELREAERYNERHRWSRNHYSPRRYRPEGDPGPGVVAQVKYRDKAGFTFKWERENRGNLSWRHRGERKPVKRSITVPSDRLLNVSAYRPGDYLQFYADPRTRADYIQWAPLLLAAEDWHAQQGEARRTRTEEKEADDDE